MIESKIIRIGNLGAGVQSTTLYLLEREGKNPACEAWIFADTGDEPKAVYAHLDWLESLGGTRIIRACLTVGLGDQIIGGGLNSTGQRFISIPAFTTELDHQRREGRPAVKPGITQRQCTKEYKINVIEQVIRCDILGLNKRQRVRRGTRVEQVFGLSSDEAGRIKRVRRNYEGHPWARPVFPLAEMGWTREKCVGYLAVRVPHTVQRSACVYCPYRSPHEWLDLRNNDPEGFARAVAVDEALRKPANIFNRCIDQPLYLHRSCLPLPMVDFDGDVKRREIRPKQKDLFELLDVAEECSGCSAGMCGV